MKLKYLIFAVLIIGCLALVGNRIVKNKNLSKSAGDANGNGATGKTNVRLSGIIAKHQNFVNSLSVSGSIEANEQVQLRSQVAGIVTNIYFKEGSKVKKGALLLTIDNIELKAQLEQALARERLSAENENRARILLEKNGVSQQEYDVAFADLRSLQAQTKLIKAQLSKTTLEAPFDGTIGLRSVSQGEYLTQDKIVANLVNIDLLKITFSIPEKYSSQVKVNTTFSFTVPGSNKNYSAIVYAIEPAIETATRTIKLRAKAENKDGSLFPGAFASINFPIMELQNAILVPSQAIVPIQNGKKVFVTENGKVKEVKVNASTRTDKDVLITSGLNEGDTVITTGVMSLKSGAPVTVVVNKND